MKKKSAGSPVANGIHAAKPKPAERPRLQKEVEAITLGRARRLPRDVERMYWKLSAEGREGIRRRIEWSAEDERRVAADRARAAKRTPRTISFTIDAERFSVLRQISRDGYKPGRAAGELFDWAFPLLKRLVLECTGPNLARAGRLLARVAEDATGLLPTAPRRQFEVLRRPGGAAPTPPGGDNGGAA